MVILDPQNNESEVKTDAAGRVTLGTLKPGLYSIRAKWVAAEPGKQGDQEYLQVNHYCTLALRVAK
jgi:protocatechuate 3,4-dioxygenase beta subunit